MERTYFPLAGLERGQVSIGNILRCRYHHSNDLPTGDALAGAVSHCTTAHLRIPSSTRVVIAQGWLAWDVLTGQLTADGRSKGVPLKVTDWRGFLAPLPMVSGGGLVGLPTAQPRGPKPAAPLLYTPTITSSETTPLSRNPPPVYGVLHLSDRNKDNQQVFAARKDWSKVPQIISGTWPLAVPSRLILTEDSQWSEVEQWFHTVRQNNETVYCDTEYFPDGKMTVLGLGSKCSTTTGITTTGIQVQWLTSSVSSWVRAKLCQELQRTIREVPCVFHNAVADMPILHSNMGVQLDSYCRIEDTMLAHASLWSELPHDLEFLASIYGQYPKLKHLAKTDLLLYNWGDVLATIDVWNALEKELANDRGSAGVYRDQLINLIPIILESQAHGLRVNGERVRQAQVEYTRIIRDSLDRVSAFTGWPTNLGSSTQLCAYLYGERGYPKDRGKSSADGANIHRLRQHVGPAFDPEDEERRGGLTLEEAIIRTESGGDPVLELRAAYSGALQCLSHYIEPCLGTGDGRIYPRFATHCQACGRWSTTCPPLAQLPDFLRDIICPDPGECWIGWDWSNIEPRLKQAYCGSEYLKRVFDNGWDLHTLNFCAAFGYPIPPDLGSRTLHTSSINESWRQLVKWQGKEDVRRVFSKRLQYKMDYGGSPETAIQIPGAKQLGMAASKLRTVGYNILQADPQAMAWRTRIISEAQRTRRVVTFTGRVRRLLGTDLRSIAREAINFPLQAGVSDIFNTTVIEVKRQCPWVRFAWQMHDSLYWAVPAERASEGLSILRQIAERPFVIEGRQVCFPADFKQVIYGV